MATITHDETTGRFHFNLSKDETDVLYRVLSLTKKNAEKTRLPIARHILDEIAQAYLPTISYDEDMALSTDHFGSVCFTESKH